MSDSLMRSFQGKRVVLPVPGHIPLLWVVAGIGIIAVLLGRSAPEPMPDRLPRLPAHPRYLGIKGSWFSDHPDTPRLLDTETGAVSLYTAGGTQGLDELSCSPWQDGEGRYHLAGRWRDFMGDRSRGLPDGSGLARCTFPEGLVLDRVGLDVSVWGRPCWAPDVSDRVLFTGGDGQLYLYDSPEVRTSDPAPPQVLRWQTDALGTGVSWQRDPCWSSLPALGGRLLVSQLPRSSQSGPTPGFQLWWLELSADGGSIVGAEQVIVPEGLGPTSPRDEERLPNVGLSRDGTPLLAYLARDRGQANWELWLMPIAPAQTGRGPRVLTAAGRKLAEGCAPVLPAFSADGQWIYAGRSVGGNLRLERLAIDPSPSPFAVPSVRRIDCAQAATRLQ